MKQQAADPGNKGKRNPWAWIPTLYFAEGIPYVVAMTVAVIMYKRLGISNTDIALYTSWLYLPWVIKPFWSPFVDLIRTKRWWITSMQLLIGAGLGAIAFLIPVPFFFQATLAILWLVAFSSATHDIAADGFYMLALDQHEQSYFVGIRSTFYRLSMITGQGILIILAGALESATGLEPVQFKVQASPDAPAAIVPDMTQQILPQDEEMRFITFPEALQLNTGTITPDSLQRIKDFATQANTANGFVAAATETTTATSEKKGWWSRYLSDPLAAALKKAFGVKQQEIAPVSGNAGIIAIRLTRQPQPDEEVILNLTQDKGDQSIHLIEGERLVFTAANWDKPAYAVIQLDHKLQESSEAIFKGLSGNIPLSWSITFFVLAGLFVGFYVYHRFILPYPASDHASDKHTPKDILIEFGNTFVSFFKKKNIGVAIAFMLLYRLGEAMLVKMSSPFLLDARELGGLGLTTGEVGLVYGTVGVIFLTLGGIIGGIVASRQGLKFWMWPMALCITLPHLAYLFLSWAQPENLFVINVAVAIEQFGYGFGFTAYMLYLIYISDGAHKTAHYALCTGFMALGMMLPGMVAGWLQEIIGYHNFFIWVMICAIPTLAIIPFVKVDANFGKK